MSRETLQLGDPRKSDSDNEPPQEPEKTVPESGGGLANVSFQNAGGESSGDD